MLGVFQGFLWAGGQRVHSSSSAIPAWVLDAGASFHLWVESGWKVLGQLQHRSRGVLGEGCSS